MIKVVHLSHTDIKYDGRIIKEIVSLDAANYDLLAVGVNMSEGAKYSNLTNNINIISINLWSRKLFLPKFLKHSLSVLEIFFKMFITVIKYKPDIIHCHDTLVLPLGVVTKKLLRAHLIYDAHELESNRNGLSRGLGRLTFRAEKLLWKNVDALITVSPSIQSWYMNNLGKKLSSIILNTPDTRNFNLNESNNYLRDKFSIPKKSKIFIYVGIIAKGRGIEQLIEIFKSNNHGSHIVFLGYGELSSYVNNHAKKYDFIHLHSAVSHEKVIDVASSADVGVCFIENISLSDYYCLPNKLFEYIFSGIPVIASDFPDIKDLIKKYNIGYSCSTDEKDIAFAIEKFTLTDDISRVKSSTIYDLSWQAQEKKLLNLYRKLISN